MLLHSRTRVILASLAGAVVIVGGAWLWLAQRAEPRRSGGDELAVAATIFPLADIARQVGGEHVQVQLIIPPGVSEHSHALGPRQLQELQQVQAIFQIGHGLDERLVERIVTTVPEGRVVTVDQGIALREFGEHEAEDEHEGAEEADEDDHEHAAGVDPHYWLTVPNASRIAATIADELARLDPAHADDFARNLATYQEGLAALEAELQVQAAGMPRKAFIAMHDAWSYFADHYGLELAATYEPVEGREPSLQDLLRLRRVIAEYQLTAFFAEPQKSGGTVTSFMQREFGLTVLQLDPVGGSPGRDSYPRLMRANMQALVQGSHAEQ